MMSHIEQSLIFSDGCLHHIITRFPHGCTLLRIHSALVPSRLEDVLTVVDGSGRESWLFKIHKDRVGYVELGGSFDETSLPLTLHWMKATSSSASPRKDDDGDGQPSKKSKILDDDYEQRWFGQLTIRYTVGDADVISESIPNKSTSSSSCFLMTYV
jgi:hypothetical protein